MMFYVYDPAPEQPDEGFPVLCGGYPNATLYGTFANASHPEDMNGSAIVLAMVDGWDELVKAADPSV